MNSAARSNATSLWTWCVRVYASPTVGRRCLRLQDRHGQCVPLLLWGAWRDAQGVVPTATDIRRAVRSARAWHATVLVPIRALRRRLKRRVAAMSQPGRLACRTQVKALELACERRLLLDLETLVPGDRGSRHRIHRLPTLRRIAAAWSDAVPVAELDSLAAALAAPTSPARRRPITSRRK